MNIFLRILFMAIIGGLIGYITNVVAIKMLFKPYEPIKIPLTNIEIMGLIPKRRAEIAKNVAETVKRELLSEEDIFNGIIKDEDKAEIAGYINSKVSNIIAEKLISYSSSLVNKINGYISDIVDKEVGNAIDDLGSNFIERNRG